MVTLLFLSLHVKFQKMAALGAPLLALQVQPFNAPAWTELISLFILDPKKPTTHAFCSQTVLVTLSLLRKPTIWAKVTSS